MENDYNVDELVNIIDDLITVCEAKLKKGELIFILNMLNKLQHGIRLDQNERDKLIKVYDGVRDIPGE